MNKSQFVNRDNLELLWEVLLDELHINKTNNILISNVKTIFESNINLFVSRSNPKTNILEQNKQFLNQVLLAVNQLLPKQNIKRINITDEEVPEIYKIEDIQAARQTDFEKELEIKKKELENYMIPTKPKELDFSDRNFSSLPNMESLLADQIAERSLNFEQIYNNYYNEVNEVKSTITPEQWLTPKKTSVNSEKTEQTKNISNGRLKYINIDNDNNINIINNNKKVSFNENITSNILEEVPGSNTISIFQKLKKTNLENDANFPVEQSKYEQQNSILLPRQEEILKNDSNSSSLQKVLLNQTVHQNVQQKVHQNVQQNVPIISNTEIVKQLNDMNSKIDKLYEMVFKLTKIEVNDKNIIVDF